MNNYKDKEIIKNIFLFHNRRKKNKSHACKVKNIIRVGGLLHKQKKKLKKDFNNWIEYCKPLVKGEIEAYILLYKEKNSLLKKLNEKLLHQCCVCYKIKRGKKWVMPREKKILNATHSYCEACWKIEEKKHNLV